MIEWEWRAEGGIEPSAQLGLSPERAAALVVGTPVSMSHPRLLPSPVPMQVIEIHRRMNGAIVYLKLLEVRDAAAVLAQSWPQTLELPPAEPEREPLPGHLCEQCLDAPAVRLVSAPWGGEMGVCLSCLVLAGEASCP